MQTFERLPHHAVPDVCSAPTAAARLRSAEGRMASSSARSSCSSLGPSSSSTSSTSAARGSSSSSSATSILSSLAPAALARDLSSEGLRLASAALHEAGGAPPRDDNRDGVGALTRLAKTVARPTRHCANSLATKAESEQPEGPGDRRNTCAAPLPTPPFHRTP